MRKLPLAVAALLACAASPALAQSGSGTPASRAAARGPGCPQSVHSAEAGGRSGRSESAKRHG